MRISDEDFIKFLIKYQNIRHYKLSKGYRYFFKLISAPNPTNRMQYNIEFDADNWEKKHHCPAKLSMQFLDDFNSGSLCVRVVVASIEQKSLQFDRAIERLHDNRIFTGV